MGYGKSKATQRFQFSSVTQSCPTFCDPMDCSMPGFPVHSQLLEFARTHVHRVSDAPLLSHPLSPPSPPALNLSQHQGLFQLVGSLHQVAKVLEVQLQHQSFQCIFRVEIFFRISFRSPEYSQESSPAPQFKSISSSVLSCLYGTTLTSIRDYWKNHSFVGKVMSLLFNVLSRFVIVFLPRNKHLLI